MCLPMIPAAGLGAMAGAGGASYAGATTAGILFAATAAAASSGAAGANYEAAKYNEKLAKNNQVSLNNDAENARIAGAQESAQAYRKAQKTAARNRVEYAAGGVAIDAGTPLSVNENVAAVGALDQLTILHNADKMALGLETEGANQVLAAKAKKHNAALQVGTSILSSAASGYFGAATPTRSAAPVLS